MALECRIHMATIKHEWISFGGCSAIVTCTSLILGLDAAASSGQAIASSLLIFAVADNLSDSLSMHTYQEAERLESRQAFISTVANFVTRLLVTSTFIAISLSLPRRWLSLVAGTWGFILLTLLTYLLANDRGSHVGEEIAKHLGAAVIVIALSRGLGTWLAAAFQ